MAWSENVTRRAALQEILDGFATIEDAQESVRAFTRNGGSGIENYLRGALAEANDTNTEADCNDTVAELKSELEAVLAKVNAALS